MVDYRQVWTSHRSINFWRLGPASMPHGRCCVMRPMDMHACWTPGDPLSIVATLTKETPERGTIRLDYQNSGLSKQRTKWTSSLQATYLRYIKEGLCSISKIWCALLISTVYNRCHKPLWISYVIMCSSWCWITGKTSRVRLSRTPWRWDSRGL